MEEEDLRNCTLNQGMPSQAGERPMVMEHWRLNQVTRSQCRHGSSRNPSHVSITNAGQPSLVVGSYVVFPALDNGVAPKTTVRRRGYGGNKYWRPRQVISLPHSRAHSRLTTSAGRRKGKAGGGQTHAIFQATVKDGGGEHTDE